MRFLVTAALLVGATACEQRPAPPAAGSGHSQEPPRQAREVPATAAPSRPTPAPTPSPASAVDHLRVEGTEWRHGNTRFHWRGISAFGLAEMIAHGREAEAIAFLDWAAARQLTVVRVLLMARHLFQLTPAEGVEALPRLLELAAARGLHVEIVALADTADIPLNIEQHVTAVGAIAARHRNALIEIANEPWHPTQDRTLHDPSYVATLARLVPGGVPVALGSAETDARYAEGIYATWHAPRRTDEAGWNHVLALSAGATLLAQWRKPAVSDEPIGAAERLVPGRRDNHPARFHAAAVLTVLTGLGPTFHYEGGLRALIPSGREAECFAAWRDGLDMMTELPGGGKFLSEREVASVATVSHARAAFARQFENAIWVVAIDPEEGASVTWQAGWSSVDQRTAAGVRVFRARR